MNCPTCLKPKLFLIDSDIQKDKQDKYFFCKKCEQSFSVEFVDGMKAGLKLHEFITNNMMYELKAKIRDIFDEKLANINY